VPFINQYSKEDTLRNYYYSEEFVEGEEVFIFSAGQTLGNALISRINKNGDLEWEKVYRVTEEPDTVAIRKMIQLGPRHNDGKPRKYIAYITTGKRNYFMAIDNKGSIQWAMQLYWNQEDVIFHIEPCRTDNSFYLVISNHKFINSDLSPFIAKFDDNGNLRIGLRLILGQKEFIVNAVRSHDKGVALAGHYIENDSIGLIVDLDSNLKLREVLEISSPALSIHDIEVPETGVFLVSGHLVKEKNLFVCIIKEEGGTRIYNFPGSVDFSSSLALAGKGFYILQYNESNGILHKTGWDFLIEWTKEIKLAEQQPNGMYIINFNADTAKLTFDSYNTLLYSFVGYTDEDLNSCKTVELDRILLVALDGSVRRIDMHHKDAGIIQKEWQMKEEDIYSQKTESCPEDVKGIPIEITEDTSLQSPNFYLQAAGSDGSDGSARGIHLRWTFSGALGNKHLPKGNYASTSFHFNKQDDFVRVYRAPYYKFQVRLDLSTPAQVVDDNNKVWIYRLQSKVFYVYFRNSTKYDQVRSFIQPLENPMGFIRSYGSEIIEIENKKELFFTAELHVTHALQNSFVQTESLSVAENALAVPKITSSRKTFTSADLNDIRLICENGRSIRFKPGNCIVSIVRFECYTDFINIANKSDGWMFIGEFALTMADQLAFDRLESEPGTVNKKWQRFNDNAYVSINNYRVKWNGPRPSWDRNIRMVVEKYISLSDGPSNPNATEIVHMESGGGGADDSIEISNLDLLNIAAYDYHIARILGLGHLDLSSQAMTGQHIYIAAYYTKGDLEDGFGAREVHHLSMSLPTAITDQRLPLPVNLEKIVPGAFWATESDEPVIITAADGYSHDGKLRYVTLYSEDLPKGQASKPFYFSNREFQASTFTFPVYAGVEYRKKRNGEADPGFWEKPELPNDPRYQNEVDLNQLKHNETIPLALPDAQKPLYIHRQDVSGLHYYSSYGINWFSRAVMSNRIFDIQTDLKPANLLKPPTNINALLIRQESPLLLTSIEEQERFNAIAAGQDNTLVRLTFDYHLFQELVEYKVQQSSALTNSQLEIDTSTIFPDANEVFADRIEIFFRNQVPLNISGKAMEVTDHPNPLLSIIKTGKYNLISAGQVLAPIIAPGSELNFIGGVFIMNDQKFIIHDIIQPTGLMQGPSFIVYKKEISDGIVTDEIPSPDSENLQPPQILGDGLFMGVENMQNAVSWGIHNPHSFKVNIGSGWSIHREVITVTGIDGQPERQLEKTRGIWKNAFIETVDEPLPDGSGTSHQGLYRFTFEGFTLAQHEQYIGNNVSVEWYQGIVRVHTMLNANGTRKIVKVAKIDISVGNTLILYAYDSSFSNSAEYDKIQTGNSIQVNFYPGYKLYLYTNPAYGLTLTNILPTVDEGVHYSIFSLRSIDLDETDQNGEFYKSRNSIPQLMFAQEIVEALPPELPQGSFYATRPDFFGRSTYTFKNKYAHQPYGVLCYRSNDEALLNALYEQQSIRLIRAALEKLGGNNETFFANRWLNFLDFTTLQTEGDYNEYPIDAPDKYKFPHPDKKAFFDWANIILQKLGQPLIIDSPGSLAAGDSKIINFVKGAVFSAFVPLTEVPIIYQYIKGVGYQPIQKKQVIRDRDGHLLPPTDPVFDIAPMMKITGGLGYETQFTDFTLDGTSNNIYFYGIRELSTQMKMSDFSPFLGPVKLVNTNPPEAPEIKRIMPVLENEQLNTLPFIQFELNQYPPVQKIKKINIYRAFNKIDAQSVRTMSMIKMVDLEARGVIADAVWLVKDAFEDLPEIPYGDGLYYRLTVSREVQYFDKNGTIITEYAPSQPSRLVATMMVEVKKPPAPVLTAVSDPLNGQNEFHFVMLRWQKTTYKGRYHVYKMTGTGNWTKIHELKSNLPVIYLPLKNTDLHSDVLTIKKTDSNPIYHQFKVVAENTAGKQSSEENILVIPDGNWEDIGGIDDMIIESTFIVRP